MKHSLFTFLTLCLALAGCSDPGSDYVGNWVLRDYGFEITIAKSGGVYQVSGYPAFSGGYVLDADGRLVNGNIENTRLEYDDENDILVWAGNDLWPATSVFERATLGEPTSPQTGSSNGAVPLETPLVIPDETKSSADSNGLVGRWQTTYAYYASTVTATIEIKQQPNDSCAEYLCIWTTTGGTADNDRKTWCAQATSGMLAADTKMGGRAAHMYAVKKDDRTLSVTFSYNSDEILPWRLEFQKQ